MESTAQLSIDEARPIGYAINRGGPPPGGMDTKSPVWGILTDWHDPGNCLLVITKFVDGSPVIVRYRRRDIVITSVRFSQMLGVDYHKEVL